MAYAASDKPRIRWAAGAWQMACCSRYGHAVWFVYGPTPEEVYAEWDRMCYLITGQYGNGEVVRGKVRSATA